MKKDTLNDNLLYDGWMKIKRIFHCERPYEKLQMYSGVSGIVTSKDNKILLVKQFRPCINKYTYEIPAGCLDKKNENIEEALIRELKEETNIDKQNIKSMEKVIEYYSMSGVTDAKTYMYIVKTNLKSSDKEINISDDDEVVSAKWFSFNELLTMINNHDIMDNKTQRAYDYITYNKLLDYTLNKIVK